MRKLNEGLLKLNEWVRLAKWTPIKLNAPRIRLAQSCIRPAHTLNLAKRRLIKLNEPLISHAQRLICAAQPPIRARWTRGF